VPFLPLTFLFKDSEHLRGGSRLSIVRPRCLPVDVSRDRKVLRRSRTRQFRKGIIGFWPHALLLTIDGSLQLKGKKKKKKTFFIYLTRLHRWLASGWKMWLSCSTLSTSSGRLSTSPQNLASAIPRAFRLTSAFPRFLRSHSTNPTRRGTIRPRESSRAKTTSIVFSLRLATLTSNCLIPPRRLPVRESAWIASTGLLCRAMFTLWAESYRPIESRRNVISWRTWPRPSWDSPEPVTPSSTFVLVEVTLE